MSRLPSKHSRYPERKTPNEQSRDGPMTSKAEPFVDEKTGIACTSYPNFRVKHLSLFRK